MYNYSDHDTICALATPPGRSAIAVVRVSGPKSWDMAVQVAKSLEEKSLKSHCAYFSKLYSPILNEIFDEALLTFFEEGRSYSGERTVEISTHGSMAIVNHLLDSFLHLGARTAGPGEFTYRAFMNDRMDLTQAEGVLSLIHAESITQAKQGLRHLGGELSRSALSIENDFIWLLAQIEAGIDFATEGLELQSSQILINRVGETEKKLSNILAASSTGKILKDGIRIALIGLPNVGKSSLLNNLIGEDRALVTEVAGTTRDFIEGHVFIDGVKVTFVDTAGLRDTTDRVESLGIERSFDMAGSADLVIWVVNPEEPGAVSERFLNNHMLEAGNLQLLFTMADKIPSSSRSDAEERFSKIISAPVLGWVSNLEGLQVRSTVTKFIQQHFNTSEVGDQSLALHSRQEEFLRKALESIGTARAELIDGVGPELVATTLRSGLFSIQALLGHHYDDQILDRIFSEFCIGK